MNDLYHNFLITTGSYQIAIYFGKLWSYFPGVICEIRP